MALLSLDRHDVLETILRSNSLHEAFLRVAKLPAVGEYRTATNADRIRSMTDEELAELWWERVDCGECPMHRDCRMTGQDCKKLALGWLQEEAKE